MTIFATSSPTSSRRAPQVLPPLTGEQQGVVEAVREPGALMVLGGPGTGKTTTLMSIIASQVADGRDLASIVVLTGSRPQAHDLRSAIVDVVGATQMGMRVTTIHGWAHNVWGMSVRDDEAMWRTLNAPEQEFRVRELLEGTDPTRWPASLQEALSTRRFAMDIRAFLAQARQLGLDPDDVISEGISRNVSEWRAAGHFFQEYLDVLDAEGVVDYAEVVHRATLALADDGPRLLEGVEMVLCDEYAESDPGMARFLRQVHASGVKVCLFADPDSVLSAFRGADESVVRDAPTMFSTPTHPLRVMHLGTNLRSHPALDKALHQVSTRLPAVLGAKPTISPVVPVPSLHGLDEPLVAVRCENETQQAEWIAQQFRQARALRGWAWRDMAVLTSGNKVAVSALTRALSVAGIPVHAVGDELALGQEAAVRHLLTLVRTAATLEGGEHLTWSTAESLLTGPIGGMDVMDVRAALALIQHRAAQQGVSDDPRLLMAAEIAAPRFIAEDDTSPLRQIAAMRTLVATLREGVRDEVDVASLLWSAWSATSWPERLRQQALAGGRDAPRAHRDLDAVIVLFDIAERNVDLRGMRGIKQLVFTVASQRIAGDTARESARQMDAVQVLSVYRAKGRQWKQVAIVNLNEGRWPSLSRGFNILRPDALNDDHAGGFTASLMAERRAFHCALGRARDRVILACYDAMEDTPSRFIVDVGLIASPPSPVEMPATVTALVARLRAIMTDQTSSPALRQAAREELRWLASDDGHGRARVRDADPSRWWGAQAFTPSVESRTDVSISTVGLGRLLKCPRKWFLESVLSSVSTSSTKALVGTIVHSCIEYATREHADRQQILDHLHDLVASSMISEEWNSDQLLDDATSAIDHFLAWRSAWQGSALAPRPIAVERDFHLEEECGDVTLHVTGKIDRIDMCADGSLVVIDFKTGKAITQAEAASDLQLGVYQQAVIDGRVEGLPEDPQVSRAMLVYLMESTKKGYSDRRQESLTTVPFLDADVDPTRAPHRNWLVECLHIAARYLRDDYYPAIPSRACPRCPLKADCPSAMRGDE